ncbi:MAG: GreA/GreB family elongation factor [Phycisphaerae bacterium]|jgi:regulator of nucleoside diphosphate kinase
MDNQAFHITDYDMKRLKDFLQKAQYWPEEDAKLLDRLRAKLDFAVVTSQKEAPPYLVTMNSHVKIVDLNSRKDKVFWLVYPEEACFGEDKVSIISELGIAVLGSKTGDTVQCVSNSVKKQIRIARIYYQPETYKHYNL